VVDASPREWLTVLSRTEAVLCAIGGRAEGTFPELLNKAPDPTVVLVVPENRIGCKDFVSLFDDNARMGPADEGLCRLSTSSSSPPLAATFIS
jgi:hypothetical protein